MTKKYIEFLAKSRVFIIVFWVFLAAVMLWQAPSLSNVGTTDEATFLPSNAESVKVKETIKQKFPGEQAVSSGVAVVRRDGGLTNEDNDYIKEITEKLTGKDKPKTVSTVISPSNRPELAGQLVSKDHSTAIIQINLSSIAFDKKSQKDIKAVRDLLLSEKPAGLEAHFTGQAGILTDLTKSIEDSIAITTIATIILVVVILLLTYRSPVAMMVPLLTIGISFLVGRGVLGILAAQGWKLSSLLGAFIIVLIFGVGTDYCLFLISRFREETKNNEVNVAFYNTMHKVGHVILASAGTVIVGFLGMAIADFGMIATMGPALAITIAITLLAALTLTPALISVFGSHLFWPFSNGARRERSSVWEKVAAFTSRYPVVVTVLIVAVLGISYTQLPNTKTSFDMLKELPSSADSVKGFDVLQGSFEKGDMMPLTVIVPSKSSDLTPQALKEIGGLDRAVSDIPGVGRVQSFVHPEGVGKQSPFLITEQLRSLREQFSADPKASQPPVSNQASTTEQLKPLQDYLSDLAKAYPDVRQDASYQRIVGMLAGIEKAQNKQGASLTLVQVQQIRMQEAQAMAQISQDLGVLEKAFSQIDYLYPSALAAANPQFNQLKAQFLSGDMKTIKTIVVLKDDPYSTEAFENVRKIRSDIKAMGSEKSILEYQQAAVGGATAEFADVEDTINRDFIKIGALTIAGVLVILVLLLRSAIAPWYLVATVIFSYGATIGISTVLFQEVLGQTGISYFIPIILFVLLVALGADYNIFLISRIREEADKIGTKAGIQSASAATGGIITSAGIILAGTFAALALSPLQSLFQIGLAVAIGVLIDTFIIRAVLVPALASIFGEWNWWPHRTGIRLRKRVTEVGYEKGGS